MKEKTASDVYYTQGEYVSFFDRGFTLQCIEDAASIRNEALNLAESLGIKPKEKSGGALRQNKKTITLPRRVWEETYKKHKT